jgi:hypothetical protein
MPPVHARLRARLETRHASDAQAFVTITAFQDDSMEMELPDVLFPLRSLADGAVFAVPPLEGKWTAGEVKLRYDSARDVLSLWTPSVTTHSTTGIAIRCVPRAVPVHDAAPFVVSSWRDIDSEKAVYVDSLYDPAVGWYGEPVAWWKAHGIGRPLGFRRSVQVEVDDSVAVNEQAARARIVRLGTNRTHVPAAR